MHNNIVISSHLATPQSFHRRGKLRQVALKASQGYFICLQSKFSYHEQAELDDIDWFEELFPSCVYEESRVRPSEPSVLVLGFQR